MKGSDRFHTNVAMISDYIKCNNILLTHDGYRYPYKTYTIIICSIELAVQFTELWPSHAGSQSNFIWCTFTSDTPGITAELNIWIAANNKKLSKNNAGALGCSYILPLSCKNC